MSRERKSKVTTEIAERVTASLRAGADWALAARLAGVCKQTLRTYMQAHPQIAEEWEAARSEADDLIVKSLFDRARKGDTTATTKTPKSSECRRGAQLTDINSAIRTEQSNQIDKHPIRPATNLHWLAVTTEELAESLEEIRRIEDGVIRTILELGRRTQDVAESLDCRDREDAIALLRKELIQAAACVHSWIEWVDERYPDLSQDRHSATIEVPVGLTDVDGDDEP